MHDKSNAPKGHKDHQRTKILVFLANWASEMFSYQGFEEHLLLLETLKQVYIESDWANDREQRMEVIQLFNQLEDLFQNLDRYNHDDFKDVDKLILNLTA